MKVWYDGEDWVIAEDEADATVVWEAHTSEKRDGDAWAEWTGTGSFDLDDGRGPVAMTAADILASHGRGFFASHNW